MKCENFFQQPDILSGFGVVGIGSEHRYEIVVGLIEAAFTMVFFPALQV